jgi:adenylate cyclase
MKALITRLRQKLNTATTGHLLMRMLLGMGIVAAALANHVGLIKFQPVDQLELISYDMRLNAFAPRTVDPNVVIVDIDERSIAEQGRFPWSRDRVATLTNNLFDVYGVKVVGFDVLFGEPDTSSGLPILETIAANEMKNAPEFQQFLAANREALDYDGLFAKSLANRPIALSFFIGATGHNKGVLPQHTFTVGQLDSLIPVNAIAKGPAHSGNLARFAEVAPLGGHAYPVVDDDGLIRRIPMLAQVGDNIYDSLSLATLRLALDNAPIKIQRKKSSDTPYMIIGDYTIPLDVNLAAYVPYRGPRGYIKYVSATDVIKKRLPVEELKGKIVLVGTSAQGLLDLRSTPVQVDLPGVEIHAAMVAGVLERRVMEKSVQEYGATGFIILFFGALLAIILPLAGAARSTVITVVVIALIVALNLFLWQRYLLIYTLTLPIITFLALYFFNMAYGFFTESRSKRLITARFGEYIPRELVEEMAANPDLATMEGDSREMTVLFSDVRSFTTISEGLTATELSSLMNAYLTPMTEIIQAGRGTIDKYIGDAIMCFWGAPLPDKQHASHGVAAALAMQARLGPLGDEFAARGWPRLEIGVGLNCGEMRVGNMGSRFRRAYTVMGDNVNLGSRLEAATKDYGVGIIVSESIVRQAPEFVYKELDRIRVKGKLEPVTIYEPIGKGGEVPTEALDAVDLFHRALDRFRAQRWDDAELLLVRLTKVDRNLKLIKEYRDRIAHFRVHPPGPQWDGVFTRTAK